VAKKKNGRPRMRPEDKAPQKSRAGLGPQHGKVGRPRKNPEDARRRASSGGAGWFAESPERRRDIKVAERDFEWHPWTID